MLLEQGRGVIVEKVPVEPYDVKPLAPLSVILYIFSVVFALAWAMRTRSMSGATGRLGKRYAIP
jgi:hypothetical protein